MEPFVTAVSCSIAQSHPRRHGSGEMKPLIAAVSRYIAQSHWRKHARGESSPAGIGRRLIFHFPFSYYRYWGLTQGIAQLQFCICNSVTRQLVNHEKPRNSRYRFKPGHHRSLL